jgi:hypothetical protein
VCKVERKIERIERFVGAQVVHGSRPFGAGLRNEDRLLGRGGRQLQAALNSFAQVKPLL